MLRSDYRYYQLQCLTFYVNSCLFGTIFYCGQSMSFIHFCVHFYLRTLQVQPFGKFIFTCGLSASHFIDSMTKSCLSFFTQINFLTAFLEMSDIQYDRQNCVSNFHLSFHVHTAERGSNSWYLYKHHSAYLGFLS